MAERYWIETLGCPKNQVDSDKLVGTLTGDGFVAADSPEEADLVVVNTCAFIEAARQESIDTVLTLADARRDGARLVVTGCMAERYGDELAEALPEVDLVAPFGASLTGVPAGSGATPVTFGKKPEAALPSFDLLNLPRPHATAPWSYVKVAEGCDRNCGFCAIPSFRGKQRSRTVASILDEVDQLGAATGTLAEVVLVAQDLSSFALDRSNGRTVPRIDGPAVGGNRPIVDLVAAVAERVRWTRLLYLYPSTLDDALVEAILATGVPYFDLSLQHVSRPLLKRMRRWGEGDRFLDRIALDPVGRADRRVPLVVHRRVPRRDRGGPRPAAGLDRRGPARLGRLLPVQQRGRHVRCRPRRTGARRAGDRADRRVHRAAGRHHGGQARGAHRLDGRGTRRRAGRGPHLPRGPRDRRHRHRARAPAGRLVRRGGGDRRRRPRPHGRPWPARVRTGPAPLVAAGTGGRA